MRVDDLHFSVRFLQGLAEVHDCALDRPSLVYAEAKRELEASDLLCAEVSEEGVKVAVLELYLEAVFDGSQVQGFLHYLRCAFYLICLHPLLDLILLRLLIDLKLR